MGPGVSPFAETPRDHNLFQTVALVELRFPRDGKEEEDRLLEEDGKRLELLDVYEFGELTIEEMEQNEPDPLYTALAAQ